VQGLAVEGMSPQENNKWLSITAVWGKKKNSRVSGLQNANFRVGMSVTKLFQKSW
jgi:hypothetical protein